MFESGRYTVERLNNQVVKVTSKKAKARHIYTIGSNPKLTCDCMVSSDCGHVQAAYAFLDAEKAQSTVISQKSALAGALA